MNDSAGQMGEAMKRARERHDQAARAGGDRAAAGSRPAALDAPAARAAAQRILADFIPQARRVVAPLPVGEWRFIGSRGSNLYKWEPWNVEGWHLGDAWMGASWMFEEGWHRKVYGEPGLVVLTDSRAVMGTVYAPDYHRQRRGFRRMQTDSINAERGSIDWETTAREPESGPVEVRWGHIGDGRPGYYRTRDSNSPKPLEDFLADWLIAAQGR